AVAFLQRGAHPAAILAPGREIHEVRGRNRRRRSVCAKPGHVAGVGVRSRHRLMLRKLATTREPQTLGEQFERLECRTLARQDVEKELTEEAHAESADEERDAPQIAVDDVPLLAGE